VTPLFENRDFVRLFSAALLSNYGSMVRGVALPWLAVLVLDAEPRHMALLGAAALLPGFALGLLAAPFRWGLELSSCFRLCCGLLRRRLP